MLFISINTFIYSQNTLTGTVKEYQTELPINYASVYFPQLEKGATTNEEGIFIINDLPKGTYKFIISLIGYSSYSENITIGNSNNIEVTLSPSAIEIEEIILSTPFHKLQSENVMKVERLSIASLKTKGIVTLSEGLSNIAGVASISTGTGIGKPVIRGLNSNRVLVYTQGVRLENQQFGGEHGLGVNQAGIESIEVIKGPASLLYGSDALGGVLYLNPEKFANQNKTEGDINLDYFSNTLGYATNAGLRSSGDNFKFLIRGAYTSHTDYETGNGVSVTNSRFNEYDLKTGFGYQKNKFKTEVRYNFNKSELGIPEEIGVQNNKRELLDPYQIIDNHILSSKTNLFFDKSSLEITLGYIFNNRKEFEDHEHHEEEEEEEENHEEEEHGEKPALDMDLKTFNYTIHYNLPKIGKLESIIGIQGMYQNNENFGEEILIPDAITNDFGLLATSHYHLSKSDLQIGFRFDFREINVKETGDIDQESYFPELNKNFNSFNAALGLKTDITNSITTRINLASGFRAPNIAELTSNGSHEGANRYEVGNSELDNEQNIQVDLALEYKNEHFEFFINGFYNSINNFIFLSPNGEFIDEDPVFLYNQNHAKLYGGEIGVHLHPHPLDWLHIESSFETVTGKLNNDSYLPLIPANSLTNTLRVEFNKLDCTHCEALKAAYSFVTMKNVFKQNNVSGFETATNGYTLLSLGLGSTVTIFNQPVDLKLSANNLLNETYISHLSRLKPDGVSNIGRNINLGMRITL